MGDLAGARPYFEQAYTIREKSLGTKHPDTAQSLWWLGVIAERDSDRSKARDLYQQALAIYEHALGTDHATTKSVHRFLENVS